LPFATYLKAFKNYPKYFRGTKVANSKTSNFSQLAICHPKIHPMSESCKGDDLADYSV